MSDLDRDGALDIVVANAGQPNAVYFNGELRELPFGEPDHLSYGVAVGDLNGDDSPDVVVANSGAPPVVYFNVPAKRSSGNWPSVRGPNASGLADGLGLPTEWDGESS